MNVLKKLKIVYNKMNKIVINVKMASKYVN